jgi:tetratricopeptide (TPR) repeat protein
MRDAFAAAVSEGLPLYAAAEPGTQDKALLGRALANSYRGRGIAYQHLGQDEKALADLKEAHDLAILPGQGEAYIGIDVLLDMIRTSRAHIWKKRGQKELAVQAFEESLRWHRSGAAAEAKSAASAARAIQVIGAQSMLGVQLNNLASAYADTGRLEEAEELWEEALNSDGDPLERASVHHNRACRQGQRGQRSLADFEAAVALYREGGAIGQMAHSLTFCLSILQNRDTADYEKAGRVFDELVAILPQLGRGIDANCAICLEEMGRPAEGREVVVQYNCFHAYHRQCLRLCRQHCPMCNR